MMVDTAAGAEKPDEADLIKPLSPDVIASMRAWSPDEMRRRLVRADDLVWSGRGLLDHVIPGHASRLAPVIGYGMSEDRDTAAPITNPHGFSVEWLRIPPGQQVGPFRVHPKQVLIVRDGALEIELGRGADASRAVAEPWATFSVPQDEWRTLRSVGQEEVLVSVTTAGDARVVIEWDEAIVEAARLAGVAHDPNGYLAPVDLLPAD
jgi:hypothetical protein